MVGLRLIPSNKMPDCVKSISISLKNAKQILAKWLGPQEDDESMPHLEGLLYIDDRLESWLHWGDFMNVEFDIEQYAFVQWSDGK